MKIYFVRHGVTEGNIKNHYQLPTISLSEKGFEQANFIADRIKNENIPIDIIFSSPMKRASQTAHVIADKIGHSVIDNELFEEVKSPSVVRGKSKEDPEVKAIMQQVKANFTNSDWKHSDEENYFLVRDRAKKALDFLLSRKEQNILVVTHGEILKMMLSIVIHGDDLTPQIYEKIKSVFAVFNTGISKLEFNDLGWYIRAWNDHAHLGETQ